MKDEITTKKLRTFGVIWALILMFLAHKFHDLTVILGLAAFAFIFTAVVCPWVYTSTRIYQNWIRVGEFIGRINSFIIVTILFYGLFAPIGLVLRLLKKDLLSKKIDRAATSYFIKRTTQPGAMKNQF